MAEDNDDAIPYCIATGDIKKLVTFFTGRGQLLEALLIAQVQRGSRNAKYKDNDKVMRSQNCSFLEDWMNGGLWWDTGNRQRIVLDKEVE